MLLILGFAPLKNTIHESLLMKNNYEKITIRLVCYVFDIANDSAAGMLLTLFSAIELIANCALLI